MTSDREGRSLAEWVTFAGSCLILALVFSLILVQMRDPRDPPAPIAVVSGDTRVVDGQHHVSVAVSNVGDATAGNVQVTAELEVDGSTAGGDQTIDFLAGGEEVDLVFVFDDDPARGELTVTVAGYSVP